MIPIKHKVFKNIFLIMILSLAVFFFIGCTKDDEIKLSFESTSYSVKVDETLKLAPKIEKGKDVVEKIDLVYSSEHPEIATYTNGEVKGILVGETKVRVALKSDEKVFVEVTIKVTEDSVVEPTKFTVTFDVDGEITTDEVEKDKLVAVPTAPIKEGYVFLGWFIGEEEYDFETAVTANITLVAKWKEIVKYTVTFDNDGVKTDVEVVENEKVDEPAAPTKDGYQFKGWFVGEEEYDFETTITANITLIAKWEELEVTSTLTYEYNGGYPMYASREKMVEAFMADFNKMFEMDIVASEFQSETFQKGVPAIFTDETYGPKWVWMKEYIIKVAKDQAHASSTNLEANDDGVWRASIDSFLNKRVFEGWPYSANFSSASAANGFWDILAGNTQYTNNETLTLVIPAKEGHIFGGWFLNSDLSGDAITAIPVGTKVNTTVYAKWEKIPMVIVEEVPTFTKNTPELFNIATVANGDKGAMVRAYFTLPEGVTVEYQEGGEGAWIALVDVFGPEAGFPLGDINTQFRGTFANIGEFNINVQFKQVSDGTVLGSKDITVTVIGSISDARTAAKGAEVSAKGIVTSRIGNNAFIQDETDGIYLYLGSATTYNTELQVGNIVIVTGTRDIFNDLAQISTLTAVNVVETNQPLPEAVVLEGLVLADVLAQEGKLISISGLKIKSIPTITSEHYTVIVTDGTVDLDVRIDKSIANYAELKAHFELMVVGQTIDLVNIPVGRYKNNPQVMSSQVEQLVVYPLTDAEKVELVKTDLTTEFNEKQYASENTITLPTTSSVHGGTIAWVSNNEVVNVETGAIGIATEDTLVVLTATITIGEVTDTLDVTISIVVSQSVASYSYDFEGLEALAYTATSVKLGDLTWNTKECYVQNPAGDASDRISATEAQGQQMLRLRGKNAAYLELAEFYSGITTFTFDAKYYNSNNNTAVMKVSKMVEGGSWEVLQTINLSEAYQTFNVVINETGNVKVRIDVTSKSVNVDNIKFY